LSASGFTASPHGRLIAPLPVLLPQKRPAGAKKILKILQS
jgi:hypothetical protein